MQSRQQKTCLVALLIDAMRAAAAGGPLELKRGWIGALSLSKLRWGAGEDPILALGSARVWLRAGMFTCWPFGGHGRAGLKAPSHALDSLMALREDVAAFPSLVAAKTSTQCVQGVHAHSCLSSWLAQGQPLLPTKGPGTRKIVLGMWRTATAMPNFAVQGLRDFAF
eukprot:1151900-Pelagomonas_calceolata.AAC.2